MKNLNNLASISIKALAALMIFASCKKENPEPEPEPTPTPTMMSSTYTYEFNNGQVVPTAPYSGMHMDNFSATMMVEELSANETRISVTLNNTVSGEMYMVHAHDAADPATTPNGTPYDETPNADVFAQMATGNGGSVTVSQTITMSYSSIVDTYQGFFVVHDPLQALSTTDITTYLAVGAFARAQPETNYASDTYNYAFNTGQVDPSFAYNGTHATNLSATLKIQELAEGNARVSITLMNSINGEMYMVHAHDMADPATTPNGTPYDETPNADVLATMLTGNGGTITNSQISIMSHADLTAAYDAFLVVHDPLQALSTTDPTTYVVLGVFASN